MTSKAFNIKKNIYIKKKEKSVFLVNNKLCIFKITKSNIYCSYKCHITVSVYESV